MPPLAPTVAEPSLLPLQVVLLLAVMEDVSAVGGSVMVTEIISEQPLVSVIVTVYVPVARLEIIADDAPVFHE